MPHIHGKSAFVAKWIVAKRRSPAVAMHALPCQSGLSMAIRCSSVATASALLAHLGPQFTLMLGMCSFALSLAACSRPPLALAPARSSCHNKAL
jgi:hypothetical protein